MISGKTCQWKARIHRVYSSDKSLIGLYGPRCEKTCLQRFVNNTGADQPAHPLSDQRLCYGYLESIISKLATSEMPIFYLVPVAEETGLSLVFFRNPKDRFSRDEAHIHYILCSLIFRIHHDRASGKQGSIEFTKGTTYSVKKGKNGELCVVRQVLMHTL